MKINSSNHRRPIPDARAGSLFAASLVSILALTGLMLPANASTLTFPVAPLFVANSVAPNIMLMIDSSGSMNNAVPETPYDSTVTYSAPCTTKVSTGSSIFAKVQIGGAPFFATSADGTTIPWGAGAGQCFDPTLTYGTPASGQRVYLNPNTTSSGNLIYDGSYLGTSYSGNYLNWYFNPSSVAGVTWNAGQQLKPISATDSVKSRISIVKTGATTLADTLDSRLRIGLSDYNTANVGGFYGGVLLDGVTTLGAVGSAKRTTLKSRINSISAGGATPLSSTLSDIGHYFQHGSTSTNLTIHPTTSPTTVSAATLFSNHSFAVASGADGTTDPIQYSCQRNFAILLTDGRPQNDQVTSAGFADYDGDCTGAAATANSCTGSLDEKTTRTYESAGSDYLDDVAQALREIDLRPDFPVETSDGTQFLNNVTTYLIGFADPAVQNDPLVKAAADATHGGGGFFPAVDAASLNDIFAKIGQTILKTGGSFSSVAANSTRLNTGSSLFQANFNSGDWSGELLSYLVSTGVGGSCSAVTKGLPCTTATWRAATQLATQGTTGTAAGDRAILSYSTVAPRGGISFRWASLNSTQKAALNIDPDSSPLVADTNGSLRLDYLRGDQTHEPSSSTPSFRPRSSRLGDIVNSDPFFVGAPPQSYTFNSYSTFRSTYKNRSPVVYVGANDGMLHGFDAATGKEVLAYVPSKAYGTTSTPTLSRLTQKNYTHQNVVDGSPIVGDAFIGGVWKSILVGGMRAGGQGLFALDVTDPTTFKESNTSTVLWEFTDADDADLGYTFSKPSIVKMANGKFAAIVGNGYNNTETDTSISGAGTNSVAANAGKSAIFIIFLDGPTGTGGTWTRGTDYIKILTTAGTTISPNGMATPAPVDVNGDGMVDYIYAGDELGNLWRFDVNNADPTTWAVAYSGSPLFIAKDGATATRQPITVAPEVGFNRLLTGFANPSAPKLAIYFGTGRYIDTSDNTVTAQLTQTFYGIFDSFTGTAAPTFTRTNLLQQTILQEVDSTGGACSTSLSGGCFRISSNNNFTNADGMLDGAKGWYIDLTNTGLSVANNLGERQITNPVLRSGKVFFTTAIPSSNPCSPGGTGFLMELDASNGSRFAKSKIDINGDSNITDADNIAVTVGSTTTTYSVAGVRSKIGVLSSPTFLSVDDTNEEIYAEGSGGKFGSTRGSAGGRLGRISWREIVQ